MDCCSQCGRIILVILNFLVLIIGMALFVVGIMVKSGSSLINDLLDSAQKSLQDSVSDSGFGTLDTSSFNIAEFIGSAAVYIIVLGVFLSIIGICGVFGACCKNRVLLVVYLVFIIIIFLAQVIMVIIIFGARGVIDDSAKPALRDMIVDNFISFNSTDGTSLVWNVVMKLRGCCGVDSYKDFENATKWVRDYQPPIGHLNTPLVCCKPDSLNIPFDCAKTPTNMTSNYLTGCYDSLWDWLMTESVLMIVSISVILVIQLLLILYTIWIIRQITKEKRVHQKDERSNAVKMEQQTTDC